MSPPSRFAATAGQGKANFGFWIVDCEFWMVDWGEEKPNGGCWILNFEWWIEDDVECWVLNVGFWI